MIIIILCACLAYFLGAIPTGLWIAKFYGVNIREQGSGNIGATNVLRSVGKIPALIVILADPLKSLLAILIARWLGLDMWGIALSGLCTALGNNFNIFLGFRGGKGVATSIGIFLGIAPLSTLFALCIGVLTIFLGRFVSLGSLIGVFSLIILYLRSPHAHLAAILLSIILFALTLLRHQQNIQRLKDGIERRIGDKAKESSKEI